jgi:hypothetical protein
MGLLPLQPRPIFLSRAKEILDKEGPYIKRKFRPIHALSKLAYRMQKISFFVIGRAQSVTVRKATPLKQLKSLSYC